ncbi:MAG: lipid A biosynthesis acyltransferase [Flavobacteriales bacterium]|nr:lipid A biosynthesis acyltransferase [Flavobacteriales bacterium]
MIVSFLTYRVIRYRRKVVHGNLVRAFPDKSAAEIQKIERDFYRHFMDFIAESIKAVSISKKQVLKRTSIKNPELLEELAKQNRSVIVVCGHYNNWEFYALSLPELVPSYTPYSVYQPLSNPFFDKILFRSRTRYGMNLIKTREVIPFFKNSTHQEKLVVIVNDQSPSNKKKAHWNTFLNQETGWNIGPEKLAQKFDHVVLFGHSERVKRGYYEVEFKLITEDPPSMPKGEITDVYSKMLEELIISDPKNWLWSHKRWKHQRPDGV